MKNFLFILTLLFGILLFAPEDVASNDVVNIPEKETVMKEKKTSDMQHQLEILSNDLKSSNCLTPRRIVQPTTNTFNLRIQKGAEKVLQVIRLKEANLLGKVSENVTICQTINLSTLLSRMGYHVYALRKIII